MQRRAQHTLEALVASLHPLKAHTNTHFVVYNSATNWSAGPVPLAGAGAGADAVLVVLFHAAATFGVRRAGSCILMLACKIGDNNRGHQHETRS